jgi:hypothetical protein
LQDFELVEQGEAFKGELPPGAERSGQRKKDHFEHPSMLYLPQCNRNGRKAG